MDLLERVAIIAVIAVLIIAAVGAVYYFVIAPKVQKTLTASQAEQFVINDLKSGSPSANITVINVSNSTLKKGSYNIVLSIVYNATRPCPTLFIEAFDYPATGLVPSIDNLYTKDCIIYGISDAPSYVISSPEIAIARSYNQSVNHGINQVTYYVSDYGYNNTAVTAQYYPYLNNTQTNLGKSYYNVWLVRYKAAAANFSVYTVIGNSTVLANYTQPG
jgi:hypothetical protein